jgi:hypothetical protein
VTEGISRTQAEIFAFLVLNQAGSAPLAPRYLRQLGPLHDVLRSVIPQADDFAVPGLDSALGFRLHRKVIQIRDAMLALAPYTDSQVASAAVSACRVAGVTGDDMAAVVEASVLASALETKLAKQSPRRTGNDVSWRPVSGSDLASEAAWLGRVSQAFAQMPRPGERTAVERTDTG